MSKSQTATSTPKSILKQINNHQNVHTKINTNLYYGQPAQLESHDVKHHKVHQEQIKFYTDLDNDVLSEEPLEFGPVTTHEAKQQAASKHTNGSIYKSLYLLHNNEISKEIIKLIMYSTDAFIKKLLIDLKLKSDEELFANLHKKKYFLIKLKEFLIGPTHHLISDKDLCLNDKFNKNIVNLMHRCHFMLSEPDLPVQRLLNEIDRKFVKHKHVHRPSVGNASYPNTGCLIEDHYLSNPAIFTMNTMNTMKTAVSKCLTAPDNISNECCDGLISNSLPEQYYQNQPYSLFNPIKNSLKKKDENYILFKTFRSKSIQPLVKEFKRKKYFNKRFPSEEIIDESDESTDDSTSESSSYCGSIDDTQGQQQLPALNKSRIQFNLDYDEKANNGKEFNDLNLKEKSIALLKVNKQRNKIVRFADSLGLDLETVKIISSNSFETGTTMSPYAATPFEFDLFKPTYLRDLPFELQSLQTPKPDRNAYHLVIIPNFSTQDEVDFDCNVRLESHMYDYDNRMLKCVCKCKNLAYSKIVYAHTTFNNWSTHVNYDANYVRSQNAIDYFEFFIFLPDLKTQYTSTMTTTNDFLSKCLLRIEFAVCFICAGQTFWDNNNGKNYVFECYLQKS